MRFQSNNNRRTQVVLGWIHCVHRPPAWFSSFSSSSSLLSFNCFLTIHSIDCKPLSVVHHCHLASRGIFLLCSSSSIRPSFALPCWPFSDSFFLFKFKALSWYLYVGIVYFMCMTNEYQKILESLWSHLLFKGFFIKTKSINVSYFLLISRKWLFHNFIVV